jgi:hypothetical protein
MDHLAFKGGTCLRKLIFGSAGRFSEDLDFTLDSDRLDDRTHSSLLLLGICDVAAGSLRSTPRIRRCSAGGRSHSDNGQVQGEASKVSGL